MDKGNYDWKEAIFVSFLIALMTFLVLMITFGVIHSTSGEYYTSDKVVDCNDLDGDVMEDIICHEKISCSNILKFLNEEGCEDFIGDDKE